jgi:hypothetical protein
MSARSMAVCAQLPSKNVKTGGQPMAELDVGSISNIILVSAAEA